MNTALRRHQKIFVIFMCLVIHSLIMMSIIVVQFNDDTKSPTILFADLEPEQKNQLKTDEEWVALNNSLPATQCMAIPTPPLPSSDTPITQEKLLEPTPSCATNTNQEKSEATTQESATEEIALEESLDKAITIATQLLEKSMPPKEKKESKPQQQSNESIEPTHQELTLAQLAQGYMHQVQQHAAMAVESDTNGTASMEQIKHLNYCRKIIDCLVNSYKINKYGAPKGEPPQRVCVQLAINEDGTIHTLRIVQSSGDPTLDQFLMDMFRDASSSFPPIPQSFTQKPYHLPLFTIDRIESFQTSQGWYINNRRS